MTLTLTADSPLIQSLREDIERRAGKLVEERALLVDYARASMALQQLLAAYFQYPFDETMKQRIQQQLAACAESAARWQAWLDKQE
jgi:predicted component of type VI protein secretion system